MRTETASNKLHKKLLLQSKRCCTQNLHAVCTLAGLMTASLQASALHAPALPSAARASVAAHRPAAHQRALAQQSELQRSPSAAAAAGQPHPAMPAHVHAAPQQRPAHLPLLQRPCTAAAGQPHHAVPSLTALICAARRQSPPRMLLLQCCCCTAAAAAAGQQRSHPCTRVAGHCCRGVTSCLPCHTPTARAPSSCQAKGPRAQPLHGADLHQPYCPSGVPKRTGWGRAARQLQVQVQVKPPTPTRPHPTSCRHRAPAQPG